MGQDGLSKAAWRTSARAGPAAAPFPERYSPNNRLPPTANSAAPMAAPLMPLGLADNRLFRATVVTEFMNSINRAPSFSKS